MIRRMKMIIIFITGVIITSIGMVLFLFFPGMLGENHQAYSFMIMLAGLFFVAIGAVKGKKKLIDHQRSGDFFSQSMKDFYGGEGNNKGNAAKPAQEKQVKGGREQVQPDSLFVSPKKNKTLFGFSGGDGKENPKEVEMPRKLFQPARPSEESQDESGEHIVKVYICPGCDAENSENHMFCSSCGKRLKKATPSKHSVRAKQTKLPGKKK